jgi:hypothetical protein
MNDCIEMIEQIKEQDMDCSYSKLTALCGIYVYSAMKDWAVEAKKTISKKGSDES